MLFRRRNLRGEYLTALEAYGRLRWKLPVSDNRGACADATNACVDNVTLLTLRLTLLALALTLLTLRLTLHAGAYADTVDVCADAFKWINEVISYAFFD